MVGQTMKNTFTLLETIKTQNGKTVIFKKELIAEYFKNNYEQNFANLTDEEKQETFRIDNEYNDLLVKVLKEPMHKMFDDIGITWALPDTERNPIEEYEFVLSSPKDEDLTEEQHYAKLERLRQHKEWYEKQIS